MASGGASGREDDSGARVLVGAVVIAALVAGLTVSTAVLMDRIACEPPTDGGEAEHSVARMWNEVTLDAIRRDTPSPVVHARNLFHLSAAMWDAAAAHDPDLDPLFIDAEATTEADVDATISWAAHTLLTHRYSEELALGSAESAADFDELLDDLCLESPGMSEAAQLGRSIAEGIIAANLNDGAEESNGYERDGWYTAVNEPLFLGGLGTSAVDPDRWQPLEFAIVPTDQHGNPVDWTVQTFLGPHWGTVDAFALDADPDGLPLDPGPPPLLASDRDAFLDGVIEVIERSAVLDPSDGQMLDISPASLGDNPLGTDEGDGHDVNPVTGDPYSANEVLLGDFGRVVAEYWADGPASETPPGHWNTIANSVSDHPDLVRRVGGDGPELDALEWDLRLYVALNGALHDTAVAVWGAKGFYDYSRPISMIRYLSQNGQSSDPTGPSYAEDGIRLVDGLVEVVTEDSSAPGERHEHLAPFVGDIAVRSWSGYVDDPETETAGVEWILGAAWVPYQRPTFVTPAFAAYVSGHSAFSRASAEVLTAMTGSPYFPGGLGTHTFPEGSLVFEAGPTEDIELQWATYRDAADQAGISRRYGGIHVPVDDHPGRLMGEQIGMAAWERASRLWQ